MSARGYARHSVCPQLSFFIHPTAGIGDDVIPIIGRLQGERRLRRRIRCLDAGFRDNRFVVTNMSKTEF